MQQVSEYQDNYVKETAKMDTSTDIDQRVKKFDFIDLLLIQSSAMFFGLFIAKLIPQLMTLSAWWFIALSVLCSARPSCIFWFKK